MTCPATMSQAQNEKGPGALRPRAESTGLRVEETIGGWIALQSTDPNQFITAMLQCNMLFSLWAS